MRLSRPTIALLPALCLMTSAEGQVWEKLILPGLTYRMEFDASVPRVLQAIRYSPPSEWVTARAELGKGKVYTQNIANSRGTISEAVRANGAIGGVNADFFPFTGDPLGLMIRSGELVSAPYEGRSTFGWNKNGASFGLATMKATCVPDGGTEMAVDRYNEECSGNRLCLNTPTAGFAKGKGTTAMAVLQVTSGAFAANKVVEAQIVAITPDTNLAVAPGSAILTGTGTRAADLVALGVGRKLKIRIQFDSANWTSVENAVGGGPALLRNGVIVNDWSAQGFNEAFALKRHPRTAVGRTKEGDIWFIAVDGRQETGDGATLQELAIILKRLGCTDAINLDGGGSTTMNLFGMTMNRPSDGTERPVADGVLFYRNGATDQSGFQPLASEFKIEAPDSISLKEARRLKAFTADGRPLANRDVIWAASGAAWIDQGGLLHPLKPGTAKVYAWVGGRLASASVEVRGN